MCQKLIDDATPLSVGIGRGGVDLEDSLESAGAIGTIGHGLPRCLQRVAVAIAPIDRWPKDGGAIAAGGQGSATIL